MFAFLRRLLGRRPSPRQTFTFHAGGRRHHADPLAVETRLRDAAGENWVEAVIELAKLSRPLKPVVADSIGAAAVAERAARFEKQVRKVVEMGRKGFELPPLDTRTGQGVTDAECLAVVREYLDFAERLAENALPLAYWPGAESHSAP